MDSKAKKEKKKEKLFEDVSTADNDIPFHQYCTLIKNYLLSVTL